MGTINRVQQQKGPSYSCVTSILGLLILSVLVLRGSQDPLAGSSPLRAPATAPLAQSVSSHIDYHVDETCTNLPSIRPSGSYFLDEKISAGASSEGVNPSFHVGSYFAQKVPYHMKADAPNFQLMKEFIGDKKAGLAVDFGANQGFYTYYLAALGLEVHSFEIDAANFRALQHGAEFNPKDIADRVNLYPVGVGEKNARFGMKGGNYEGFLQQGKEGPILGVSFDCFAYHMRGKLDFSNVDVVKLDVEGFEIAVLRGGKNSLFKRGINIGSMIMEVGPSRWGRSSHDLATGIEEMIYLASLFKNSYILVRGKGTSYWETCPVSLADDLADKHPRKLENQYLHKVKMEEWRAILEKMEKNKFDCNFIYRN